MHPFIHTCILSLCITGDLCGPFDTGNYSIYVHCMPLHTHYSPISSCRDHVLRLRSHRLLHSTYIYIATYGLHTHNAMHTFYACIQSNSTRSSLKFQSEEARIKVDLFKLNIWFTKMKLPSHFSTNVSNITQVHLNLDVRPKERKS